MPHISFFYYRLYSGLAHEELNTLYSCVLVDEFEQNLKNMENYNTALHHMLNLCPDLHTYLNSYAVPAPGDWPTWYYQKKIIAQQTLNHMLISLIPEQGPLHVSLNSQEDVISIYHFFFSQVYKDIFGSDLPREPKPFRVQLLLMGVLCGWIMIREKVLSKFGFCKDLEYACLLHILDEVIPLVFFHYTLIFRSGTLDTYISVMFRFLILFIIWERRHYDKSTLSMLSDMLHQKFNFPQYYKTKENYLTLFTEIKVEIWHSLLRSRTQPHHQAQEIQEHAQLLMGSKTGKVFEENLTRTYNRGSADKDLTLIAGKAAEFLLGMMQRIARNLGKSKEVNFVISLQPVEDVTKLACSVNIREIQVKFLFCKFMDKDTICEDHKLAKERDHTNTMIC